MSLRHRMLHIANRYVIGDVAVRIISSYMRFFDVVEEHPSTG